MWTKQVKTAKMLLKGSLVKLHVDLLEKNITSRNKKIPVGYATEIFPLKMTSTDVFQTKHI